MLTKGDADRRVIHETILQRTDGRARNVSGDAIPASAAQCVRPRQEGLRGRYCCSARSGGEMAREKAVVCANVSLPLQYPSCCPPISAATPCTFV